MSKVPILRSRVPVKVVSSAVKSKKSQPNKIDFKVYLKRVLKQLHPELDISSKTVTILNQLTMDMFERIANEAANLVRLSQKATLTGDDVMAATKLVLSGELAKYAHNAGTAALNRYKDNKA